MCSAPAVAWPHPRPSFLRGACHAGLSPEKQLPETMGAGAALADFNGDGHLDLYLVQSGPLPLSTERGDAPPNELWLGRGDGTFVDATPQSGAAAHRCCGRHIGKSLHTTRRAPG